MGLRKLFYSMWSEMNVGVDFKIGIKVWGLLFVSFLFLFLSIASLHRLCSSILCTFMPLNFVLLLQTFSPIKWPDCLALTHKLKAFSTQLTTPTVTLRVLLRCFFERFSSLSRCHDNSTDECMPRILVVLQLKQQ